MKALVAFTNGTGATVNNETTGNTTSTSSTMQEITATPTSTNPPPIQAQLLSKNQQKKRRKLQIAAQAKKDRKAREKATRRAKALAEGRDLHAEEIFRLERTKMGDSKHKRRRQDDWDSKMLPLAESSFRICLDLAFENVMTKKEIKSLVSQIKYCYSYNKNSKNPSFWAATSLSGDTMALLEKETGFTEWSRRAFDGTSLSLEEYYYNSSTRRNENDDVNFIKNNVVYLTSDSDHTVTTLEHDKVYVIGGIVDRNRLKRAAINRAETLGVQTAKLPLDEHLKKMPTTRVLTCNHVFHILLKWKEHDGDWGKALQEVLPTRKAAEFFLEKGKGKG